MNAETRARRALRVQAEACDALGSPLYGSLLARMAACEDEGLAVSILDTRPESEDPISNAVALRLMAAVHRIALDGRAPDLAAWYPSCGGTDDSAGAWPAFLATMRRHRSGIERELDFGVQTNEVARCAALLPGFLWIAQTYGLPLRLLELGASAGLLSRWDRYHYRRGSWTWGPRESLVRFGDTESPPLPFSANMRVKIGERLACDRSPVDPTAAAGRLWLSSFVWPDQTLRMERLQAACAIAGDGPSVRVDQSDVGVWLDDQLSVRRRGEASIVFHAVMLQYLDSIAQRELADVLWEAGARATGDAPLAYLTLEADPGNPGRAMVRARLWPGGIERNVARSSFHGTDVTMLI